MSKMAKKKILIFSGAGIDAESGIETFRDSDGLWCNYKIDDVATPAGWRRDKQKVLDFYNERRKQLKTVEPNDAHKLIAELENDYDVVVITQNVSDLHERAGSSYVIHLHGELNKSRSTLDPNLVYDCFDDINLGDKCEKGSQLRPYIIWFNENLDPKHTKLAFSHAADADICIIVGTSMQVAPANTIPFLTKEETPIYYVDPGGFTFAMDNKRMKHFKCIKEVASIGMQKVINELKKI